MLNRLIQFFFSVTFFVLFAASCSEKKAEVLKPVEPLLKQINEVSVTTAVVEKPPANENIPPAKPKGLAILQKLTNRADMRAHNESIWQAAAVGTDFFKHDALQTHDSSNAFIKYESGSSLDLKEKTLVIFDKDPGGSRRNSDRVVLKNGMLTGATKKELWVFTDAGLVQIKPEKNKTAQTTLSINAEKKLKVSVNSGAADIVLKKNDKEFQKFNLVEKSVFEVTAKTAFEMASNKTIVTDNVEAIAKAAEEIKTPSKAELVIDSPADESTTSDENLEISGRLTDIGAKLLVNGELVEIADNLAFKKKITLVDGTNLVVFQLVRSDSSVKFYRKNIKLNRRK